ncbi:hypothetical protein F442_19183 [Phytophthora nicotianae P10297]|uniref:Uncharacterized protein n=3 Tax=Phytophthora nicotianae TaxID=4792 RepID=W2QXV8_PHYN3|nr:hypothetical protein PPTG_21693 [Phytophthora nicotianae INRA-310]ETN17776.1 hypothetical protein PPTG_21693 [Phytophthora nicotianae INRA-310]ETO62788.1 hypothetical protein F444_19362 [Phytophthora nicotianae P1976]ETP32030.1 hypothetical protein F442_19183 [Phytophthora nicotianae P10297]
MSAHDLCDLGSNVYGTDLADDGHGVKNHGTYLADVSQVRRLV